MKALTPPDLTRCQAEKRAGSFMTLGPRPMERCESQPTVIATERRKGSDGRKGSMSLCEACQGVLVQLRGPRFATFKSIGRRR